MTVDVIRLSVQAMAAALRFDFSTARHRLTMAKFHREFGLRRLN